jgi:hypothetical protein
MNGRGVAVVAAATVLALVGCTNTYLDQGKWSTTVNDYNSQEDHKALVLNLDDYRSYWVWSRDTPDEARNDAMGNCQKQSSNCQLVAVDGQLLYDVSQHFDSGGPTALDWATAAVGAAAAFANAYAGANAGGGGGGSVPSASYRGTTTSVPLSQGVAGGSGAIGGQTFGSSGASSPQCGRRYLGIMRQSVCRMGGNIPDSSITSDEDPDPIANCYSFHPC